jgi:hypothetical protein
MSSISVQPVGAAIYAQPVIAVARTPRVRPQAADQGQDADSVILSAVAEQYAQAGRSAGLSNVADGRRPIESSGYGQLSGSILNTTA